MLLIDNIKSPINNFLSEILPAWTKFIKVLMYPCVRLKHRIQYQNELYVEVFV